MDEHIIRLTEFDRVGDLEERLLGLDLAQLGQVVGVQFLLKQRPGFVDISDSTGGGEDVAACLQFEHLRLLIERPVYGFLADQPAQKGSNNS